jgi:hypothetical protein
MVHSVHTNMFPWSVTSYKANEQKCNVVLSRTRSSKRQVKQTRDSAETRSAATQGHISSHIIHGNRRTRKPTRTRHFKSWLDSQNVVCVQILNFPYHVLKEINDVLICLCIFRRNSRYVFYWKVTSTSSFIYNLSWQQRFRLTNTVNKRTC